MLLAQISDPHVTTEGTVIRSLVDTPQRLVDAFDTLAALPRTPDAVLLTGDLVNDGEPAEYDLLVDCLSAAPCPVFPIPGNHDDPALLRAAFERAGRCPVELPDDPSAGFHYVVEAPAAADGHPLRLVAFDTVVPDDHSGLVSNDSAAWLDATLAQRPDSPTIVFMHHVPYPTGAWWMDYCGVSGSELLAKVSARHSQLQRIVAGHVHRTTSTQWGPLTLSTVGSCAFLSGTGVAEGPPTLSNRRAPAALFWWNGATLVASEADHPDPALTIDLSAGREDWAEYRSAATQHGPIPKSYFGG